MFKFVLVVILTNGSGAKVPEPIATFRSPQHCEVVMDLLNKGFKEQGGANKAVCIVAMKHGEI